MRAIVSGARFCILAQVSWHFDDQHDRNVTLMTTPSSVVQGWDLVSVRNIAMNARRGQCIPQCHAVNVLAASDRRG